MGNKLLVDVLLDTFHYGAGSTAICALSAGVPMLSCLGPTYASRMGASVLAAAGAQEWICESTASYEQQAIARGIEAQRRRQAGEPTPRLDPGAMAVFDQAARVADLEAALLELWRQHRGA